MFNNNFPVPDEVFANIYIFNPIPTLINTNALKSKSNMKSMANFISCTVWQKLNNPRGQNYRKYFYF